MEPKMEPKMELKMATKSTPPPERIIKKICFIMNNISECNLKRQVDEVMSIMSPHFTRWLAESILERVTSEPKLHELYAEFVNLTSVHCNNFCNFILEMLTREIDQILSVASLDQSSGKVLKYLGGFLGRLTLARDIHLCVDLKYLIYKAYKTDPPSLDYIVPFICEILKTTKYSSTLKLTDPWVKGVLQVLKELHHVTDKLSIQFEVELLFSFLECNMKDINSSFYLRKTN
ncbi:unnamed protein product [Protopolystoma xenopodis]|uniref:CCR4-NOT transcription complex subunit 1 CAF1-binding domain-containing protein n=1 Tax=Protopolystoma xenopodis TaxID=117903 RepID=A0A448WY37_9PLAT|nr:unnamed protein product [Protopolystoma xenopodis]